MAPFSLEKIMTDLQKTIELYTSMGVPFQMVDDKQIEFYLAEEPELAELGAAILITTSFGYGDFSGILYFDKAEKFLTSGVEEF